MKTIALKLARGRTYGIVGQNGVGKTTLMTRISARDIAGFPTDIKCVFVRHEILANDNQSVLNYMEQQGKDANSASSVGEISRVLGEMGFTDKMQNSAVLELSGGWRMKLALAGAILSKADLLLLDEPTNHLDVDSVGWLVKYLNELRDTTCVIVSHDYSFLDKVASDIIHFADLQLAYYEGGWKEFASKRPEVISALPKRRTQSYFAELTGEYEALIRFPDPGPLQGVKSRLKPIIRFTDASFQYEGTDRQILKEISLKMSMTSRVALLGRNGAGKTTLLKLLVGDLELTSHPNNRGEIWRHQNLRVSYIAQHSMHHLEENLLLTPVTYIQQRFFQGRDHELAKMGSICEITGRAVRGGQLCYQVKRTGRRDDETWEPMSNLACKDAYVSKLIKNYDEKLKVLASGVELRPLHETEVKLHLQNYGIEEELATSKIKGFSGGQKSRVVLAAAMWTRPHLICLDEPTNFLDKETFKALVKAIQSFRGAVLTISHNREFVEKVANEEWNLEEGRLRVNKRASNEPEGDGEGEGEEGEAEGEGEEAK
ncbi:hypothetical protein GUITHDRAFT_157380 [Guillardia theta CCMP2712]|uniref:ABC transporter domain-containing protein n=1 Tax=Guillardia theta (strain CCMP2712) TaxID=905079 RepID=L1JN27_GUITC|nr:hypothetical protein GUITHDRAFT_157380 [Guillardia theta CCMP2712]EKX49595.1 hypothetical protein GUITHDRAFT_157380 [Guillardia theta CCMP2712]|eukprot:XP_005836575.1 hypothetical protein GUITHDRAFT_157380 [Guillardia theta CCMP2712]